MGCIISRFTLQAGKFGIEENETFRRLQAELMAVQRNALQREEETNRIIHHQKAENEKIKHDFAARIRNLNNQIHTHSKNGQLVSESELSAVHRVKDLEKQVLFPLCNISPILVIADHYIRALSIPS